MKYLVEYITASGDRRTETASGECAAEAAARYEKNGCFVVSVGDAGGGSNVAGGGAIFTSGPSRFDLMLFTRELNTLIKAGVPLPAALTIMEEHAAGKTMRSLIAGVREDVVAGKSFSAAVASRVPAFPEIYSRCVAGGEASSNLNAVLDLLADNLKKSDRLASRLFNILIYPAVVLSIAAVVMSFMVIYVVPSFEKVFLEMRIETPPYTTFFFALCSFLRGNMAWLLAAAAVTAVSLKISGLWAFIAGKAYSLALGLPWVGKILRGYSLFLFSGMLSILLRSGVPAVESLSAAAAAVERISGGRRIAGAIDALKNGASLSSAISLLGLSDDALVRMGAVGERSGKVPEMFEAVNNYYSETVENGIERLTSVIEPVVIFLLGVFMAAIILSVFMPLIRITMAGI